MTHRATLFFEPLDVLQFRDHRPFDMGYHVTAESVFPMPSVFLGCVRTALLRMRGVRFGGDGFGPTVTGLWEELLGSPAKQGTLALRGPFFARALEGKGIEPLFHVPIGLALTRDRDDKHRWYGHALHPTKLSARRFHGREATPVTHDLPWTETDHEKSTPPLFTVGGARTYLGAGAGTVTLDATHTVAIDKIYKHEDRVGIVRDDTTLTTEDQMFYVTRPFRMERGAGFAVEVDLPEGEAGKAIQALDGLVVPLGGKAHRARIRFFDAPLLPEDLASDQAGATKVWLVTPLPLSPDFAGWPMGITCAASERTVPIGGFDMAVRAPKALRRALPAGTVLWLDGIDPSNALAALGGNTWEDDRRAGYGAALAVKGVEIR